MQVSRVGECRMSVISTTAIAFSMSADAFAAAVGKGVSLQKPKLNDAIRVGLVFGGVEAVTPILGWLAGIAASSFITSVDHWIAFTILGIVGLKMLIESLRAEPEEKKQRHKMGTLILTAIGTSIDAMAVGVTMAFLKMNILIMALAIGGATFLMATIGIMAGHYIGTKGGRIAEALGGIGLIVIGCGILIEHLG